MTKTITTEVFTYAELSDKAKAVARDWYGMGYFTAEETYDQIKYDADMIGLKITGLSQRRPNAGEFMQSAFECAEAITAQHGKDCDTYKTAQVYLAGLKDLGDRPSDTDENADDGEYDDQREELDADFLCSLLEDYRIMYEKAVEYQQSEEAILDTMVANAYVFTADGKFVGSNHNQQE